MWTRKNLAVLLGVLFAALPGAVFADLIQGYFEGDASGFWEIGGFGGAPITERGTLSSEKARFSFQYDTELAPDPEPDPACRASGRCRYTSSSTPADSQWLTTSFAYGDFWGYAIPGTATTLTVEVYNDAGGGNRDGLLVFLRSDWMTNFGIIESERMLAVGSVFDEPLFDSTALPKSGDAEGLQLSGFQDEVFGGTGQDDNFRVVYGFVAERLHIVAVPEPGSFGLLLIGLAAIGLIRRHTNVKRICRAVFVAGGRIRAR